MRENFDASLSLVLKHEGGWADHPADPGGATNKGITLATYRNWLGRDVTKTELRNIPDATVAAIYRSRYWNAVKGDDLPLGVDFAVFDYGVNSGPARAAKALQRAVGAAADGKIGPLTIAAVARHGAPATITDLCRGRMAFLRGLKTWPTFGRGWTRRVTDVESTALAMRSAPTKPTPAPPPQPDDPGPTVDKPDLSQNAGCRNILGNLFRRRKAS